MSLDFTFIKYEELCNAISNSDYVTLTIKEYLLSNNKPKKFIIIRHDIDVDPYYQLRFAKLERNMDIYSTYYFRMTKEIFQQEIIRKIAEMGHEIGYHYEVLSKANGNLIRALELFKKELDVFRQIYDVKTICPHGGTITELSKAYTFSDLLYFFKSIIHGNEVLTTWSNRDLWEECDFKDFGLTGDAYLSIDFDSMLYLSDTGRSWSNKYKMKDVVANSNNPYQNLRIKKTNDVIDIINEDVVKQIYILAHAEQWKDNFRDWLEWFMAQQIRRNGKLGLKLYWKIKK